MRGFWFWLLLPAWFWVAGLFLWASCGQGVLLWLASAAACAVLFCELGQVIVHCIISIKLLSRSSTGLSALLFLLIFTWGACFWKWAEPGLYYSVRTENAVLIQKSSPLRL